MFEFDETIEQGAIIKVIGVGGGGGNAVNTMIAGSIHKVDFIVANTDAQSLRISKAPVKIQLGRELTKGLGAGSKPEVGKDAALEDREYLLESLKGSDLVFIAAGMGGGTGTGAAPVIAEVARESGALTVGVVTKPFTYEGKARTEQAERGIADLKKHVDSLIIIPNDRLISMASKNMSLFDAFKPSDDVLRQAVQGISELITSTGMMNLDFADVKTVMSVRGMAMMGIGTGTGDNRAADAVNSAISSPLLEDNDISGAKGVLVNITGSESMTMDDYNTVNRIVHEKVHAEANIKIGVVRDDNLGETIKVTVIATGFGDRFDTEKGREYRASTLPIAEKPSPAKNLLDIPTFKRDRQQTENAVRVRPVSFASYSEEDEDQYDIPTFLRKSVD
ncbi:cell division protein FtsZ [Geobacter sp. SVR]|uniref:cell division protein FtsZ n=1 Tax=Geobacter sp. SVR TaxID=2495594 RepID=UPI00143F04C4|nr:cell division protein FtsZ [Geobacter sp. SVR]BCS52300.1 cell division protein FtsZ [Geobacter sp. SVR]GCF85041.1 cell division protein FtsZ [Geobacter sp. SVR]